MLLHQILRKAIEKDDVDFIKTCLDNGLELDTMLDEKCKPLLSYAIDKNARGIVELLLKRGALINLYYQNQNDKRERVLDRAIQHWRLDAKQVATEILIRVLQELKQRVMTKERNVLLCIHGLQKSVQNREYNIAEEKTESLVTHLNKQV